MRASTMLRDVGLREVSLTDGIELGGRVESWLLAETMYGWTALEEIGERLPS